MHQILHKNYYNTENYLVQTRSQARSSRIKLLEGDSVGKNLEPNIKPEKQHANPIKGSTEKACIGQARARSKRKMFPFVQIELTDPLPNMLDQMCHKVRKVHKAHLVQMGHINLSITSRIERYYKHRLFKQFLYQNKQT